MWKGKVAIVLLPLLCACGGRSQLSSHEQSQMQLGARLQENGQGLLRPNETDDIEIKALSQMESNYRTELFAAGNDAVAIAKVKRTYAIMGQELKRQLAAYRQLALVQQGLPEGLKMAVTFEGGGLTGPNFTSVYHPLSLAAVKKVFHDFGDLYVNETIDEDGELAFERVHVKRPWSGYWYPFSDHSLYEGAEAPLRKFDLVLQKLGYDSDAAGFEVRRYQGFRPDSWEGFCDGWAIAAVMEPEPLRPLTIAGVSFSIQEQKALMTFAYLSFPVDMYGLKYMGNAATDGAYQSIHPEAFHQVVTSVLSHDRLPVVIDDTAGVQVWNKPLYSYRWQISKDPERDYAYNVIAYPWLVRERWQQSEHPTSFDDVLAPVYKYRLYVDKADEKDGKYRVVAGEWLESSYENHPGSVKRIHPNGTMFSHNKYFNQHMNVYRKLFLNK